MSACEDPSSSSGGASFDAGTAQFDAPFADTSTSTDSAPPPSDGGGTDAADAGSQLGPVSCGTPLDLSGLPGNAVANGMRAASLPGGRMLVVWFEQATVGVFTPAYRIYDGANWSATKLFANPGTVLGIQLAVDGAGNAYVLYQLAGQLTASRSVLPVGATTFGAEDSFAFDSVGPALKLVALASGALINYRPGTSAYLSTRYDVGTSTWGAPVTVTTFVTGAVGTVGSGTTNKAAAAWSYIDGVHVATFDGATWAAPVTDPTAPVAPTSDQTTVVTFANGDPYVAWMEFGAATKLRGHRYHLGTQTWDPIETIFQSADPPGSLVTQLVVDAADRLTMTFQGSLPGKPLGQIVARNLGAGAGWTAAGFDGYSGTVTLDRFGNVYSQSVPASGSSVLNRVGVTSTTWLAGAPTGFTGLNGHGLDSAAVAFDAANHANVFAIDSGKLRVVVCK